MDKEEQWLNEMADKGMVLTKIGHGIFVQKYYFEKRKDILRNSLFYDILL